MNKFIRIVNSNWSKIRTYYRQHEPYLKDRLKQYALLIRIDHPIGTLLLLWPTLWALWIAEAGVPSFHLLLVFILGVFLTRSAGAVMNDYADRNYDRYVERTRERPLTTGSVSPREAFLLIGVLLLIAFLLVLTTNRLTILLSFCAIPLAGIYPFMKRYTYIPQLFIGLAYSWGIIMAFAAAQETVPVIAWLLFIANILWAMAYDTIYAMVDREYDIQIGVKSMAILFDELDTKFIGLLQAMFFVVLTIIGRQLEFGSYYYFSMVIAVGLAIYHQYLIKDRLPTLCFRAFLNNNWLGAVVFAGIVLHYGL